MSEKHVFFILGSVRSGTTLLRDLLKMHPGLDCPQETHFFRWSEPFQSTDFDFVNRKSETLIKHREMDNVSETDFGDILTNSKDRKELFLRYLELFQQKNSDSDLRYFDKTPQNVYGLPLIKSFFPEAKIIHIVRNPLNVVASLIRGRSLLPQTLIASINFWKEAIMIINVMKPLFNGQLYELKYENLTKQPQLELSNLLSFLNEDSCDYTQHTNHIHPAENSYEKVLTPQQTALVVQELSEYMQQYGYTS